MDDSKNLFNVGKASCVAVLFVSFIVALVLLVGCAGSNIVTNAKLDRFSTDKAPAAIGPYSQGTIVNGILYASGQIALDPATGEMVGTTVQEQADQVLKNVGAMLEAAGSDYDHVIKTTCYLADINDFAAFNEVYATYFNGSLPARSAVGVSGLPKGALCEVEVIAYVK